MKTSKLEIYRIIDLKEPIRTNSIKNVSIICDNELIKFIVSGFKGVNVRNKGEIIKIYKKGEL